MTRGLWLLVNLLALSALVGAGWYAITAPELARPRLAPLGALSARLAPPPSPPTPVLRSAPEDTALLLRRKLFQPFDPAKAAEAAADAPMRDVRRESPIARTVLDPLAAPALERPGMTAEERAPVDPLRLRLTFEPPEVAQFFAWRSMDYAARASEDETMAALDAKLAAEAAAAARPAAARPAPAPTGTAASEESLLPLVARNAASAAPGVAARPRPAPRTAAASAAPAIGAADDEEAARARRIEAAATTVVEVVQPAEGGMVLLGVYTSRGRERALLRTPSGAQRVELGDEVDGWEVIEITETGVELTSGERRRSLTMP